MRADGVVSGSVSGGCIKDDLIAQTKAAFQGRSASQPQVPQLPSMLAYGVSKEEAARFGLPCGGTLRLVREPLLDTAWVEAVLDRTARHELVARQLTLATGAVRLLPATRGQPMHFDGSVLSCVFGPRWRLLLIGAGQLSPAVAQMLDFEVLVCDPREEYAATLRMLGVQRVMGMPDDVVKALAPDAHTAIVALTHDPRLDDMALPEALVSEAFYVGALGSRRNQASRKNRLADHFDLTPDALARLHGPVGLSIGAKTPAEIAVSVMAQIIQVKNAVPAVQPAPAAANCRRCCTEKPCCDTPWTRCLPAACPTTWWSAPHPGMGDSIAAAVFATRDAAGWLVLPGDLPLIQPGTLCAVANPLKHHAVVLPSVAGQRGHPVGFSGACRGELLNLRGNQGAAQIVGAHAAMKSIVNDAGAVTDIDTLEDLKRVAQGLAFGTAAGKHGQRASG